MSMMITTSTPTAAPPVPGNIAQGVPGAPALPGADAAAAFADFMNGGLAAVTFEDGAAADAEAEAPAADNAAATPEQAATELLVQEEQQALVSMQSMMLSMPLTMAMPVPVPVPAAQALPVIAGEAAAPADDAVVSATVATGSASASVPTADAESAAAPAQQPQPTAGAAAQPAFAAALGQAAAASAAPGASAAPAAPAAIVTDAPVAADAPAAPVSAAGATTTTAVAAATSELKLAAATPAAWQQPLREALGDRLQLQLSRNIDQAVIRLDPPNLGRIDIAIRHMAGTLEVNISATHSEVVRQLHTISDTMRTDLAQRQFGEVAVNVTTATRNAAGAQQAFDQQGRQRQQDGAAEESDPGRALAEAGNPSSTFSLNARESYA